MKIFIIGGSGSGKTYLANKLSKQYNIEHYDLDEIYWDNHAESYGTKRNENERQAMFEGILHKKDWIMEGVYYTWCAQCFVDADKVYILEVPRYLYRYRVIKRFIKRKIGFEKGKKETVKSLINLLKWTDSYCENDMKKIKTFIEPYDYKVIGK